jgi:hypothetical protein
MFKQYQAVQLNCDSLKQEFWGEAVELKKGQRGIVLDVLKIPNLPIGYNVEFFDKTGETIAVTTLKEKDLAPFIKKQKNVIKKQKNARH